MMRKVRLVFVKIRNDLSSIKIRADQMAPALNTVSLMPGDNDVNNSDIIIYVKYCDIPENLAARKKKGIIQILDPIDNYDFKELSKYRDYIDGFIAASVSHRILLESKFDIPVYDIPHHHSNFSEKKINVKQSKDLVIGYIGDKTHYKKVKFVEKHFTNLYKDLKYKNLEKSYLSIDIGYAYRTDKKKKKFNSSLKLLNYMSYGIPSVMNFEKGYAELGNHGRHCLFVESKAELIQSLDYLQANYELRKYMSHECYKKAKDFHISKIAVRYREFIKREYNLDIQ